MIDFEDYYHEKTGFDVGRINIDNMDYYSEDYVRFLEAILNELSK